MNIYPLGFYTYIFTVIIMCTLNDELQGRGEGEEEEEEGEEEEEEEEDENGEIGILAISHMSLYW